jgi:hypothetical protein
MSRVMFLIQAINENAAYIDMIYNDSDLTKQTKIETVCRITNIIINNSLELQTIIKNEIYE